MGTSTVDNLLVSMEINLSYQKKHHMNKGTYQIKENVMTVVMGCDDIPDFWEEDIE